MFRIVVNQFGLIVFMSLSSADSGECRIVKIDHPPRQGSEPRALSIDSSGGTRLSPIARDYFSSCRHQVVFSARFAK